MSCLEKCIISIGQTADDLEVFLHRQFDTKKGLTEDESMNIIIGIIQLHKSRYDNLWECFESVIKENGIKDDVDKCKDSVLEYDKIELAPLYDPDEPMREVKGLYDSLEDE